MIYFAQHVESELIKIGYAADMTARLPSLASVYGAMKVIGVMPGEYDDEQAMHRQFKAFNVRGKLIGREWFAASPALMEYIAAHCEPLNQSYEVKRRVKAPAKAFDLVSTVPAALARKEERDGKRYTQKEVAAATGISNATISRIFQGDIESMNLGTMRKLVEWLECDYGDVMKIVYPDKSDKEPT